MNRLNRLLAKYWPFLVIAIGLTFIVSTISIFWNDHVFKQTALKTEGIVKKLNLKKGVYYPVIDFQGNDGKLYTHYERSGSYPPRFKEGQKVEILYSPDNPNKAQVDSSPSLLLLFLFLGIIITITPTGVLLYRKRKEKNKNFLLKFGKHIQTKFVRVEESRRIKVNNVSPFCIRTQWLNPKTKKMHDFLSDDLWFDPTEYAKNKKFIEVLIDAKNPNKYWMDISFLPKLK